MRILRSALKTREGDSGYIEAADFDNDGDIDLADYHLWYAAYKATLAD